MQSSSSFALAYEDYVQQAVWNMPGFGSHISGSPVGVPAALQDMRLSKIWGLSAGTATLSAMWSNPADGQPLPMSIVSLLDVRTAVENDDVALLVSYIDGEGAAVQIGSEAIIHDSRATTDFVRHHHFILPSVVDACGVRLTFAARSSLVSVGRLWAGPLWRPEDGIQVPWSVSIIDPGEMGMSRGGQGYPRLRQRRRRLELPLGNMQYEQAFGTPANTALDLQQLGYRVGTTQPIIAFPRTKNPAGELDEHAIHRLGVYGHFTEPVRIRHVNGPIFSADLKVDELL